MIAAGASRCPSHESFSLRIGALIRRAGWEERAHQGRSVDLSDAVGAAAEPHEPGVSRPCRSVRLAFRGPSQPRSGPADNRRSAEARIGASGWARHQRRGGQRKASAARPDPGASSPGSFATPWRGTKSGPSCGSQARARLMHGRYPGARDRRPVTAVEVHEVDPDEYVAPAGPAGGGCLRARRPASSAARSRSSAVLGRGVPNRVFPTWRGGMNPVTQDVALGQVQRKAAPSRVRARLSAAGPCSLSPSIRCRGPSLGR